MRATHTQDVIECTACEIPMRVVPSATRGMHYLRCPECDARLSSHYSEVIERGTAARRRRPGRGSDVRWERIRARADAWFEKVDAANPYRTLGLADRSSFAEVRTRYHELASLHHPDHGGCPTEMRRIIEAYQAIRSMEARSARRPNRQR